MGDWGILACPHSPFTSGDPGEQDGASAGRCNNPAKPQAALRWMESGLRGVCLLFNSVCGERNNPTPFAKFGCGGSGGGAGQGGGFGSSNSPDARRPQSPPASVAPRP